MIYRLVTEKQQGETRLDLYLADKTELSRNTVRKIIELGGVHVNGRRVGKNGMILSENQQIEIHTDNGSLVPFRLKADHIIYRDNYIVVINKPAGIESQPTPARYKGTLYEALLFLLKEENMNRRPEMGMHQRLDRDTSGLLVFSTHPSAHKKLAQQIYHHTIHREYLALVTGEPRPPTGTIRSFLARRRRNNQMLSVDRGGKEAITHYRVIKVFQEKKETCSLLSIILETGRNHQIRAHFSEKGHPLLGDSLYGGPFMHHGKRYHRQCLHAYRLIFNHPVNGKKMDFSIKIPEEILP